MRTLKKALSLVLVLAMVLSLGVSAFAVEKAADYSDYADVKNTEAVDVLTAIGVLNGNDDGTFGPEGNFTRAAATKIIAYMTMGKTIADALPATTTEFSDVPATHWASKYIQYCVDEGIINGNGDGTFSPEGTLTAAAWSKMLLCALGYDATVEKMVGTGWEIPTTRLAMKAGVASADDLAGAFNRDAAAKLAFNTLKADVVEYATSGTTITIGDTTVNTGASKAEAVENKASDYAGRPIGTAAGQDQTMQFCEQHFPTLKMTDAAGTVDTFGRPASQWTYGKNNTVVATAAKAPAYTATVTAAKAAATTGDYTTLTANVNAVLGLTKTSDKLTGSPYLFTVNGVDQPWTGTNFNLGDKVEVYADNKVISKVVVTRETAAKITDVTANTGKATTTIDGEKVVYNYNIKIDTDLNGTADITTNDLVLAGYTSDYVKGAYLTVCLKSGAIVSSAVAETVTGAITAFSSGVSATVNGTKYSMANGSIPGYNTSVDFKTGEYALVMSSTGYVLGIATIAGKAATLTDVVYTNGKTWTEQSTKYGKTTYTVYTQVIALDGTVSDVVVGGCDVTSGSMVASTNYGVVTGFSGTTVTTSTISAGLKMISDVAATSTLPAHKALAGSCSITNHSFGTVSSSGLVLKATDKKLGGNYLTSATTFTLVKGEGATTKTSTFTGGVDYKATGSETVYTVLNTTSKGVEVVAVVVAGSTLSTTTAEMLFVPYASTTVNANGYEQVAYNMKGEAQNITVVSGDQSVTGFVTYSVNENNVYDLTAKTDAELTGGSVDWNKTVAVDAGVQFVPSYYNDYISLTDGTNTLSDIPAASIVVVDVRTAAAKASSYNGDITSVTDMITVENTYYNNGTSYYYGVEGAAYVSDAGAVVFFVTGTVQGATVQGAAVAP